MSDFIKLPKHYSQAELHRVTGESVATLQWWRAMGWLKPSKRTRKRERYNIEAYNRAVMLSAAYEGEAPVVPVIDRPKKPAAPPNFYADLRESLGLKARKKSA